MAEVDEFRDRAAACLDHAKAAGDLKAKLELLMIAVAWLDLVDLKEQNAGRETCLRGWSGQRRSDVAQVYR